MNHHKLIDEALEKAAREAGISKSKLLLNCSIDPGNYRKYRRDGKPFSDSILIELAKPELTGLDIGTLHQWRSDDEKEKLFKEFKKAQAVVEAEEKRRNKG